MSEPEQKPRMHVPWTEEERNTIKQLSTLYLRNYRAYKPFLPNRSYTQIKSYCSNNRLGLGLGDFPLAALEGNGGMHLLFVDAMKEESKNE